MMARSLIGVLPLWDDAKNSLWMLPGYMRGIEFAGGLPVMLPLTEDGALLRQIAESFDGFLFTGGQDVSPQIYGQEKQPCCGPSCPVRDSMEKRLFEEAVTRLDKPALGICRGLQFFNAVLGGDLYQDIPEQRPGSTAHVQSPPYSRPIHKVTIEENTPLKSLLGKTELMVNSYHHQGIRTLSNRLKAMAYATDGLVEAVFGPEKTFLWAVQWHPEFTPEDESSKRLFSAFVTACGRR